MLPLLPFFLFDDTPDPADRYNHLPPLKSRDRFPSEATARMQIVYCDEHLERLEWWRNGAADDGRWQRWQEETRQWRRFWELLVLANDSDFDEEFHRERLADLWRFVGAAAYRRGWHPPLIEGARLPAVPRPKPRVEVPANNVGPP